jgi:hypothetical protein
VSLLDVRKEISFCRKTDINILGVVENMSTFVCPHCSGESKIFAPVSGGAAAMCEEMQCEMIGSIPLEPKLLLSTEKGECCVKMHPDTATAKALTLVVDKIKSLCN